MKAWIRRTGEPAKPIKIAGTPAIVRQLYVASGIEYPQMRIVLPKGGLLLDILISPRIPGGGFHRDAMVELSADMLTIWIGRYGQLRDENRDAGITFEDAVLFVPYEPIDTAAMTELSLTLSTSKPTSWELFPRYLQGTV